MPSTDISSSGDYGVYHSAFDDFDWFKKFGDPDFVYEQQMARIYGWKCLRMASADVLPYDYENYGKEIAVYLESCQVQKQRPLRRQGRPTFRRSSTARVTCRKQARKCCRSNGRCFGRFGSIMNVKLEDAERALLIPEGLPNRPWFHHAIYAPGQYTGYAAVVIPGVNEAIDLGDLHRTEQQIATLAFALNRAALVLEQYR